MVLLSIVVCCVGWVTVKVAMRSCSMSGAERDELVQRLSPARIDPLLHRALVGSDASDRVRAAKWSLRITAPTGKQDFGLDQGPQRVCASGAGLESLSDGDVNVLVRVYDSAAAARDNSKLNLDSPLDETGDGVLSGSTCKRSDAEGGCWELGAQAIDGAVSVVVSSRQLPSSQVEAIAVDLAVGIADLAT